MGFHRAHRLSADAGANATSAASSGESGVIRNRTTPLPAGSLRWKMHSAEILVERQEDSVLVPRREWQPPHPRRGGTRQRSRRRPNPPRAAPPEPAPKVLVGHGFHGVLRDRKSTRLNSS